MLTTTLDEFIKSLEKLLKWSSNNPLLALFVAIFIIAFYFWCKSYIVRYHLKHSRHTLLDKLNDNDSNIRKNAALALGNIEYFRIVKPLIERLKKEKILEVKKAIIGSLIKLGTRSEFQLIQTLECNDWLTRWYAVLALGLVGTSWSVKPLNNIINNKKEKQIVKEEAISSLGRIGKHNTLKKTVLKIKKFIAIWQSTDMGDINKSLNTHEDQLVDSLLEKPLDVKHYLNDLKAILSEKENYMYYVNKYKEKKEDKKSNNYLGIIYSMNGNYDLSLTRMTKTIKLDPESAAAFHNRGNIYSRANKYEKAKADYREAIKLNPKMSAISHYALGKIYYNEKNYDNSLDEFSIAIKLDPNDALPYNGRGVVYAKLNKYEKAKDDYTKAIELNSKEADYYYNRGNALVKLKKYNEAIDDYEKCIEFISPDDAVYVENVKNNIKRLEKII